MNGKTSLAHKHELRKEIEELRTIGGQMSNVCFNLGQNTREGDLGRMVPGRDLAGMYDLAKKWDAIQRRERRS